jgi:hypothetical protein
MTRTYNVPASSTIKLNGAAPPADSLPFDPTLPHAIPLPWPGQWGQCAVVYDLYQCEAYQDAEATYMAASRTAARKVDALLLAAQALEQATGTDPAQVDARADAWAAWKAAHAPWQRADALRQLAFFGLALRLPDGSERPATDPATWAALPTRLLLWVVNEGYSQAREVLWSPLSAMPSTPQAAGAPDPAL